MNILADENVDRSVVERLRREGHAVLYAAEMEPGENDRVILDRANEMQALLITEDKDFGELVFRQRLIHAGVILVRLLGLSPAAKAAIIAGVIADHSRKLPGSFSDISPGSLRIRDRF